MSDDKRKVDLLAVGTLAAVAGVLAVNRTMIMPALIPTASMEPTIKAGKRVVGNRMAYLKVEPGRGDIVIFRLKEDNDKNYIKRVIGLPGDIVTIKEGKVYIGSSKEPMAESYVGDHSNENFGPVTVPQGEFFLLGDNRRHSFDSRFWKYPFIKKKDILARVRV